MVGGLSGLNFGQLKSEVFFRGGSLVRTLVNSNLKFSLGGLSGLNFGQLKSEVFIGGLSGPNFGQLKSL